MRAVQVIPDDLLEEPEIQRLLESLSKIKEKYYTRTNSTHSTDTSEEHQEQKYSKQGNYYAMLIPAI